MAFVPRDLPSGTVTFLFTDIEGSTRLLHELGAAAYARALGEHRRLLRDAFTSHGGVEVDTQGDAFFVAFPTAPGALAAAAEAVEGLASGRIRVRIGIHTGTPHLTDEGYVGSDVHRAARIAAAGHGGQVLVSSSTATLVGSDELRDLGPHRLKDLSEPERIYQLGVDEHPPLKTLHQTNLPIPATPFLGRAAELADIAALLARDDVRLVTLTGPGGTGKTRLALQAAASAADSYAGGVWWVPLAPLRDPALVIELAAKALGASGDLAEHIGDARLLLLLDNFEHLVEAARDLAPMLARCPNLVLLVTSREPLHLAGEQEYAVDPLQRAEAVELFMTRALAARRDVAVHREVAEICERLDDLPLAIELAAARIKLLSPAALLERLEQRLPLLAGGARDAPDRQRTLHATIEWSHDLLTTDEQRLFARLAVFRGGCTLEAAEAVADAELDILQSLVDKSLVRVRSDDRFWMLETIREFANEQLAASGEGEELERRHANFFVALAEQAETQLGRDPTVGLRLLDPEHDNLRAALDHLAATADNELRLRLTAALSDYWGLRGYFVEGHAQFVAALEACPERTALRAAALVGAGRFAADPDEELRFANEARSIYSELADVRGIADARYALANALTAAGRWAEARDLMEESVRAFEELGDHFQVVAARRGLAWTHEELGDIERYRQLTEENLVQARALGIRRIEARSAGALAMLALTEGRLTDARPLLDASYDIDRELGNVVFVTVDLVRFAAICATEARGEVAVLLLARAKTLRDEIAWRPESWAEEEYQETLQAARGLLTDEAFSRKWMEGVAMSVEDAVALVRREA
jgi:predicted ATPase/class 3 adenylate cyclase